MRLTLLLFVLGLAVVTVQGDPNPQKKGRCISKKFCPYVYHCRSGGYWCPYGYSCGKCEFPERGRCCFPSCSRHDAYVGMPCRSRSSCYPCKPCYCRYGKKRCGCARKPRLCCQTRPTSLAECNYRCPGPYKACYLFGCPRNHKGWCCRWKHCWGPWCGSCKGKRCIKPPLIWRGNKG